MRSKGARSERPLAGSFDFLSPPEIFHTVSQHPQILRLLLEQIANFHANFGGAIATGKTLKLFRKVCVRCRKGTSFDLWEAALQKFTDDRKILIHVIW